MFRCEITNKLSKPREKVTKVVVKTRSVKYRHWNREAEEVWFTQGTEIVRELNATEEGVAFWNRLTDEERQEFVKGLS
jgi:hypothetical protein